tara:strand:- start:182 stop:841 length:660 start_codon:yes stop_codon:yes gene_type:complete
MKIIPFNILPKDIRILVACEESGTLRDAFIRLGYMNTYSCDIKPNPHKNHIQGDITKILDQHWDMMIAFPPCTYLALSGNRWLYNKDKTKNIDRWNKRGKALDFVRLLMNAPIHRIAIENPMSVISSQIRKPDQIIQPWQFGHKAQKTTCLWLKNLPLLKPTKVVDKGEFVTMGNGSKMPKWYSELWKLTPKERAEQRSKTFKGIANAMADQWTRLILT